MRTLFSKAYDGDNTIDLLRMRPIGSCWWGDTYEVRVYFDRGFVANCYDNITDAVTGLIAACKRHNVTINAFAVNNINKKNR